MFSKLTSAERDLVEDSVGYMFDRFDRLHTLIGVLWEDNFADNRKEPVSPYEAEIIGEQLLLISDSIFNIIREYALMVGRKDFRGVGPYLDGARQAMATIECDEMLERVGDRADKAIIEAISNMSDKDAIRELKAILGEN